MTTKRKRSLFAIDVPEDQLNSTVEEKPETSPRRTPMAMAVKENFAALDDRQQRDLRIRQENDALAHELVRLRKHGLVTELISIDAIDSQELVRDRLESTDPEIEELKRSIADIGLSNPIRVKKGREGRFELVQGSRRLAAFKALHDESATNEQRDRWRLIPAAWFSNDDDLATSYRQMVDENLVRKDISFGEMALLALRYAKDPRTPEDDVDAAVAHLFKAAAYSKRSNIRAFAQLLMTLGESLSYPSSIPRNLGLEVRKRLETKPGEVEFLKSALSGCGSAEEELDLLQNFVKGQLQPVGRTAKKTNLSSHITLKVDGSSLQCKWRHNDLVIRGKAIGKLDQTRLESALKAFVASLEEGR